jgi:hypothetical protein
MSQGNNKQKLEAKKGIKMALFPDVETKGFSEQTQRRKKDMSQIWERSETHLRKAIESHSKSMILYSHSLSVQKNWETFNEDLGFFPHQEKSHKPKKKKKRKQTNKQTNPLSLSLFIHYCLPCIPCSSLMHDVQVSKTRRPSLTSLRTNQTVPTGTQEIAPNKERKGSERERESFDGWIEVGRRSLLTL